jgi:plasmid stabilization system protein ParE
MFKLIFTPQADSDLREIETDPRKKNILKALRRTLGFMETNLRHPSLNTHEFTSLKGPHREKVFEAYVQQKTPAAYRIFWYYSPDKKQITIVAITPHP